MSPVVAVLLVLVATARADERLTKQQLQAAGDAAVAALPKVDSAKAQTCKALPITTGAEIAAAAACYRDAGALGLAIAFWKRASKERTTPADNAAAMGAALEIGPANEAAGLFSAAALAYEEVTGTWPVTALPPHLDAKVARDLQTRAMCIYRQLGMDTEARRSQAALEGYSHRKPIDAVAICTALRPIRPPGT